MSGDYPIQIPVLLNLKQKRLDYLPDQQIWLLYRQLVLEMPVWIKLLVRGEAEKPSETTKLLGADIQFFIIVGVIR